MTLLIAEYMEDRGVEAIKARRKSASYRERLAQARLDLETIDEASTSLPSLELPGSASSPESTRPESPAEDDDEVFPVRDPGILPEDAVRGFLREILEGGKHHADDEAILSILVSGSNRSLDTRNAFLEWASNFKTIFTGGTPNPARDRRPKQNNPATKNYRRGAARASEFKRYQELYKKDKKRLAAHLFDGAPLSASEEEVPPIETVHNEFLNIFGAASPPDDHPVDLMQYEDLSYRPFTMADISDDLTGATSSAPGPDGITLAQLRTIDTSRLAVLYNGMLYLNCIPQWVKEARTSLIPKGGDGKDIGNWRPITISSMILRSINRILARRLALIPLHDAQRGFRSTDGCLANAVLLQNILKSMRAKHAAHFLLTLDLRKAFDTISHASIDRALRRWNVNPQTRKFILEGYSDCHTTIRCGQSMTGAINFSRGVKQGDPLSPILFNLVMDELLASIDPELGIQLGHERVAALAYADDLILVSNSRAAASDLLAFVGRFLENRSLQLNVKKCSALQMGALPKNKKNYSITKPLFYVEGQPIPVVQPGETFKYLGHQYGALGAQRLTLADLATQLSTLKRAPLKPAQKISLLKFFLLPRYIFYLQAATVGHLLLSKFDKMIRIATKQILHLHSSIPNAFLHADLRSGGVGILPLSSTIPMALMGRLNRLAASGDELTRTALKLDWSLSLRRRVGRLADKFGGSKLAARQYWNDQLESSISGNGLRQGQTPASTAWISNPPPMWGGRDYIKAIQLRGNALPTVGIMSNPPPLRKCRAGCEAVESLCHVLQRCPITHHARIRRHDHIVRCAGEIARNRGLQVDTEPQFRCPVVGLKKPDLVVFNDSRAAIVDVQISWEGPRPLAIAYQGKINTYSSPDFLAEVSRRYPGRQLSVLPLIVGARGTWCPNNEGVAALLNLKTTDLRRIIERTIVGSVMTHTEFMRAVWRRRRNT